MAVLNEAKPGWDELGPAESFNPELLIAKFGAREIVANGHKYRIHNTNNLKLFVEAHAIHTGQLIGEESLLTYVMFDDSLRIRTVFDRFSAWRPDTYGSVVDDLRYKKQMVDRTVDGYYASGVFFPLHNDEETPLRARRFINPDLEDLHLSQLYVPLVPFAREINPDLTPEDLCS